MSWQQTSRWWASEKWLSVLGAMGQLHPGLSVVSSLATSEQAGDQSVLCLGKGQPVAQDRAPRGPMRVFCFPALALCRAFFCRCQHLQVPPRAGGLSGSAGWRRTPFLFVRSVTRPQESRKRKGLRKAGQHHLKYWCRKTMQGQVAKWKDS